LTAQRLKDRLPSERTADYRPKLTAELEFDRRVLSRTPRTPATTAIVLLNAGMFLAIVAFGAELIFPVGTMQIGWGSNFRPYTTDGEWWRLVTSMFIHFGILHLLFNMWFLAATGPLVERLYGSISYLFIYSVSGVTAGLTSLAWHPFVNSAGASGAIFGLYGTLLAALTRSGHSIPPSVTSPLKKSILVFSVSALAIGWLHKGVDNAAHVGGFASGYLLGLALAGRLSVTEKPTTRASTILVSLAVTAGLLGTGTLFALRAASSLQGEGLFWQTQHWLARNERAALDQWLAISERARQNTLNDAQYADAVQSQVLPTWREAERRLQKIQLPDTSATFAKLQYLRAFVGSRRTAYELCIKGARDHNTDTFKRCTDELARGDQITLKRD
jgi:rhomboid protease GluP